MSLHILALAHLQITFALSKGRAWVTSRPFRPLPMVGFAPVKPREEM
jgi:hypothetical protein